MTCNRRTRLGDGSYHGLLTILSSAPFDMPSPTPAIVPNGAYLKPPTAAPASPSDDLSTSKGLISPDPALFEVSSGISTGFATSSGERLGKGLEDFINSLRPDRPPVRGLADLFAGLVGLGLLVVTVRSVGGVLTLR